VNGVKISLKKKKVSFMSKKYLKVVVSNDFIKSRNNLKAYPFT